MQIPKGRAHKSWNVVVRSGGVSKENGGWLIYSCCKPKFIFGIPPMSLLELDIF